MEWKNVPTGLGKPTNPPVHCNPFPDFTWITNTALVTPQVGLLLVGASRSNASL